MAVRVVAVPDSQGVIRLSCGGDTVEIVVPQAAPGPVRNPFMDPIVGLIAKLVSSSIHMSGGFFAMPRATGRMSGIESTAIDLKLWYENPTRSEPDAIVLRATEVDLHELSRLSQQIGRTAPDLPLVLDFRRAHNA